MYLFLKKKKKKSVNLTSSQLYHTIALVYKNDTINLKIDYLTKIFEMITGAVPSVQLKLNVILKKS